MQLYEYTQFNDRVYPNFHKNTESVDIMEHIPILWLQISAILGTAGWSREVKCPIFTPMMLTTDHYQGD